MVHEGLGDRAQPLIEDRVHLFLDILRNPSVKRLCDASRDAGQGVRISAKRDSRPDRVLEVRRVQKSPDRGGNVPLARHIERMARADLVYRPAQIVREARLDERPDLLLRMPGPREENRCGNRLPAFIPSGWLWVTSVNPRA